MDPVGGSFEGNLEVGDALGLLGNLLSSRSMPHTLTIDHANYL